MRALAIWLALRIPAPANWRPWLLGAAIGRRPQKVQETGTLVRHGFWSRTGGAFLLFLALPLAAQMQPDPFHLVPAGGGGTGMPGEGTVTSVGLAAPADLFAVSNSPVTSAGTLTLTKATVAANTCYAGPVSGGAAAPTFRALVSADIPATIASNTSGNAGTATALATDPANCAGGTLPRGISDTGAAQGCAAVNLATESTGSAPTADALAANPANCSAGNLPRGVSATGTAEGCAAVNLATESTGAAPTATALAADGTNCSGVQASQGVDASGNAQGCFTPASGTGDVVGPASASDNALPRFDGTTGKVVQNSVGLLSDTGVLSGLSQVSTSAGSATAAAVAVVQSGTGIFQNAVNDLDITLNGTGRVRFRASPEVFETTRSSDGFSIIYGDASATVPVYSFKSDTNTGLGRAGSDQVSLIAGAVEGLRVEATRATFAGRILGKKGADVASANDITLGDGNAFDITGTTQINTIATTNWTVGSTVILQFDASVTVAYNTAGTGAVILLDGAANFSATAGDTLTLMLHESAWREIARSVI